MTRLMCGGIFNAQFIANSLQNASEIILKIGHQLMQLSENFLGANYKKILRLSYDVIITYDNRKLLSHRKIILRFFCN